MLTFLQIILVIICAFYILKVLVKWILRLLIKHYLKKMNPNFEMQQPENSQKNSSLKKKNINIEEWKGGEYVDFEEVKNE